MVSWPLVPDGNDIEKKYMTLINAERNETYSQVKMPLSFRILVQTMFRKTFIYIYMHTKSYRTHMT